MYHPQKLNDQKNTCVSDSRVIAAAIVKVTHAAVLRQCVHHSGCADGVDKGRLPRC